MEEQNKRLIQHRRGLLIVPLNHRNGFLFADAVIGYRFHDVISFSNLEAALQGQLDEAALEQDLLEPNEVLGFVLLDDQIKKDLEIGRKGILLENKF